MGYENSATKSLMQQLRLKGGVEAITLTGARTLTAKDANILFLDPGGASRDVTLPAEGESNGLLFFVYNEADAAENLVIKDDGASTIVTLNQGEWAVVACDGTTWRDMPFSALADYLATANAWTAAQTFQNVLIGAASELTIASGAVAATRSYHTLDTEGDAATDDLDSITGGSAGEVLLVQLAAAARNVVLKHAVGANLIACPNATDIILDTATDWALLLHNGTQWTVVAASVLAHPVSFTVGGGWVEEALSGNRTIVHGTDPQFLRLDANGSNRDVTLPAVGAGRAYRIVNTSGGATNLVVKNAGGSTIGTLNQSEAAWFVSSGSAWKHMGIETIALS